MSKRILLVMLLTLALILAACDNQEPSESAATDLPPEADGGTEGLPDVEAAATESPESPVPDGGGAPLTVDQLTGILWQWQDLVETDPPAQSVVPNPQDYSVVFMADGTMAITADCNTVNGSYLLDAGQLRIILGPSTMAFCGDESLDAQFLNLLSKSTSGTAADIRLQLYTSEGATVGFNNAGAPPLPDVESSLGEIANTAWAWQDLVESDPAAQSVVPNPQNYTVGFRYDGTVDIQADCNRLSGTYELLGNDLAILLGPSTMAFCGEESLDQQFLALLNTVNTYARDGDRLELGTSTAATMGFTDGGSLPGTVGIAPSQITLDTAGVAESWQAYVVAERPYDASQPPGPTGLPEHIEVTFNGASPDAREPFDPVMFIIPVSAYEAMYAANDNDTITRIMNRIAQLTVELPEPLPTSGMPVLPLEQVGTAYNDLAVQVGRANAEAGSASKDGYRFASRWNQDANPVSNQGLRYVYQGFTNDGAYLVSYWNPLRTDYLPESAAGVPQETLDAFNSDPAAHIAVQAENLNGLSAADWQPDLADLDALVASLGIEGIVSSGVEDKTWAWTSRGPLGDDPAPIDNPAQYTVHYNVDGSFNYQADCNLGGGSYSVIGGFDGSIRHTLGPSTRAACLPESRSEEFLGAQAAANAFRLLPGGHQMQLTLPGGGDILTFTEAAFVDVDIPDAQPGATTATVTAPEGVFVRTGPGTNYPSLGVAAYGESGTVVGRGQDNQWWVVDAPNVPSGTAWVSAANVAVENADDVPVVPAPALPAPVPTPTPVPPPSPSLSFTADATAINMGDCSTLRWRVENIQAIWVYPAGSNYEDYPQTGQGSQQVCPEQTTTYEMRVQHIDGTTEIRSITVQVNQPNTLADTSWAVTSLNTNQLPVPGSTMTLQFVGDGTAAAYGGCNNSSGNYSAYFSGLSIGPLAGTRMSCGEAIDAQEIAYLQVLQAAATFSQSGDQLVLYAADGAEVTRFSVLRAAPLTGG